MQPNDPARPAGATTAVIFRGTGEMSRLCREMDWSATPLGPVATWPQSLRTAAGIVIEQGIAQSLCWGPELVQIYNDAYRVIMGDKHPAGLGRGVLHNWREVEADIGPLFEQVMRGETVYFEDLGLKVWRDGLLRDAFFTFSYSPVRLESGDVGGVLINCFETTRQVHARAIQAERDRLFHSLEFERARLEYVFENAPAFLAVLRGPEHVFEKVNPAYLRLVGHRDLVGKPVLEAFPEIRDQGFVELLDGVLRTGEPFVASQVPVRLALADGPSEVELFVDLSYLPFVEADGTRSGVIAHGHDVTDQVVARRDIESANERLQENALEMEMQADELQRAAAALEERTKEAEAARAEAEGSREHLARVIAQAPVAMYIARGRDHVFEVVNAAYYAMVGKRPEEMLGRPGREVFPELVPQGVFEIIEAAFDSGVPYRASAIPAVFDTDGDGVPETHHFNLVYQPLLDGRGTVYAIALVATEVSELVGAREAAEAAQREAELANRAKADFLANMSHELRTPLNAIGGYVDLIDMGIHGAVTEAQRHALARVRASQQHLLMLINDVLAFAKVEAGQIQVGARPFAVRDLLDGVEPLVAPLAAAKQISLSSADCERSLRMLGDEERVRQILLNLVGNAIKFTPAGGRVDLSCSRQGDWVEISVRDNGPGIPLDKQDAIFDPFVQLERRFSNPREGVGLGLAISRDLARAMGGDLSVHSTPDEGSTFTLRLARAATGP